ncbi:hypothetical protein [Peribacillus muralis]|uniref:hypothetical protein n=1 Tax=Peribacillus muralis TaxID=264697 RepID=UPI0009F3A1F0|nr:hypothetical protein [Peribacillus muralis]
MNERADEKGNEGCGYLYEDEFFQLVVQYRYDSEEERNTTLEKRQEVEDLMNGCLSWEGNGTCDGGDLGSGTANMFHFLVYLVKAAQTSLDELTDNDLLVGVYSFIKSGRRGIFALISRRCRY